MTNTCEMECDAADKAEATPGDGEGNGVQGEVVLRGRVIALLRHGAEFPSTKPTPVVNRRWLHVRFTESSDRASVTIAPFPSPSQDVGP